MDESSGSLDEEIIEIERMLGQENRLDFLLIRYARLNNRAGNPEMWEELTRTLRRENQWPISRWFQENIIPILKLIIIISVLAILFTTLIVWADNKDKCNDRVGAIRDELINYGYAEYVRNNSGSKVWRIRKPKELK